VDLSEAIQGYLRQVNVIQAELTLSTAIQGYLGRFNVIHDKSALSGYEQGSAAAGRRIGRLVRRRVCRRGFPEASNLVKSQGSLKIERDGGRRVQGLRRPVPGGSLAGGGRAGPEVCEAHGDARTPPDSGIDTLRHSSSGRCRSFWGIEV
jgi:hypothetical protein